MRDALWSLLDDHVAPGAGVAVIGAGHAHDLPLTRLLARASRVDLIDLDRRAARRALRREPPALRSRGRAIRQDVTGGAADRLARAVRRGRTPDAPAVPAAPLGDYDVVIADLLYTQLVFPALADAGLPGPAIELALGGPGQALFEAVVARLHASAPDGVVVHVHDVLGWWPDHQPTPAIDELLSDPERLARVRTADGPLGCDIDAALHAHGLTALERRSWGWPFEDSVEYLVQATVAASAPRR